MFRSFSQIALLGLLSLLTLAWAGCADPQTVTVHPQLGVGADLGAGDTMSFGQAPVGTVAERTVLLTALNSAAVEIRGLEIQAGDAGSQAAFSLDRPLPFLIPGSSTVEVKVRFAPESVRSYLAKATLLTNAKGRKEVVLNLVGEGVEGRLEISACDPADCGESKVSAPDPWSFGEVRGGSFQKVRINLLNGGGDELTVRSVTLEDAGPGFRLPDGMDRELVLPSLTATHFDIEFEPPAAGDGPFRAEVVVATDSAADPEVRMVLLADVKPNTAPEACLFVAEIRRPGAAVEFLEPGATVPTIEPADVVVLDVVANEGCTGDAEDPFAELRLDWAVSEAPGRLPLLQAVAGKPTQRSFTPERTGLYAVELTVTDTLGLSDMALLELDVSFDRDIAVEMSWPDSPRVDLDLHLVRAGAALFDGHNDACIWNLTSPGVGPHWPGGAPLLLFDDIGTAGLFETITLDGAEPSQTYDVYVHYYEDKRARQGAPGCSDTSSCDAGLVCSAGMCMAPVAIDLDVFLRDTAPVEMQGTLDGPCGTWHAGRITWPAAGGSPRFAEVDQHRTEGALQGAVCTP